MTPVNHSPLVSQPITSGFGSRSGEPAPVATGTAPADASSVVVLSEQAKALARFAGKGMALSLHTLNAAPQPGNAEPDAESLANRSLSRDEFDQLLTRLGATDAETQIRLEFDGNQDEAISRSEYLEGLSRTLEAGSSGGSQAFMRLMDRIGNANGMVDAYEFGTFSAAFFDSGKPRA